VRVRARYAKTGRLRFTSALDLGRVFDRALRRAQLPIAYSEGFSPHPKVSFPDALPLGYASTGEYVELTFAVPLDLETVVAGLDAALPDGLSVEDAVEVSDGSPKLASLLRASLWLLEWDRAVPGLGAACEQLLAADALPVARQRKGEPVEVDLRPAVAALVADDDQRALRCVLHAVEPPVRPTEVVLSLATFLPDLPEPALTTRVAQGSPHPDGLREALSGDLVAARAAVTYREAPR